MDKSLENLIYNLKWLRKELNLSKKQMAKSLGVGVGSLNKMENGVYPPRLKANVLLAVWDNFGIYPSVLLEIRIDENNKDALACRP